MLENNNNHNHLTCVFAEQTISYIYGEIESQEKTLFETHLHTCAICAEEFANFSAVRSSIIEWRNAEFLPLATPFIEIPHSKMPEVLEIQTVSKTPRSWFGELCRIFTLSPSFGFSTAFAVLVVSLGVLFFVNNISKNTEIADVKGNDTAQTTIFPKVENEKFSDNNSNEISDEKEIQNNTVAQSKPLFTGSKIKERKVFQDSSAKRKELIAKVSDVSNSSSNISNRETNSIKNKPSTFENKRSMFAQNGKLPRLNNVEEDEDKSLRLAELFDADGSK